MRERVGSYGVTGANTNRDRTHIAGGLLTVHIVHVGRLLLRAAQPLLVRLRQLATEFRLDELQTPPVNLYMQSMFIRSVNLYMCN